MEDKSGCYEALFTRSPMEQTWCCFLRELLILLASLVAMVQRKQQLLEEKEGEPLTKGHENH